MEPKLTYVWDEPRNPESYRGIQALKRLGIGKKEAEKTLISKDGYTLHREAKRKFHRRKVVATTINSQWQLDLMEVENFDASSNDNIRYILFAIDVVSRKVYGVPLKRKTAIDTLNGIKTLFKQAKATPQCIQSDKGREFKNKRLVKFLQEKGIKMFSSEDNVMKSSIIERFNRTIRKAIAMYRTEKNTKRYIDKLQDFIDSYNNSYHRSIHMAPNQVNQSNVVTALYHNLKPPPDDTKNNALQIGDYVRLLGTKTKFEHGYDILWTEQVFRIISVLSTVPTTYKIADLSGEEVKGSWYKQELQKVAKPEKFHWEKKLAYRTRNGQREVKIKWLGYESPKFDTWEKLADFE